jgi:hypothetical protein
MGATNGPIPLLKPGDTRTMLDAATANQVIDAINKLQRMRVIVGADNSSSKIESDGDGPVLMVSKADLVKALGNMATRNLTISSSQPSGGNNGDIWFQPSP